MEDKLVSFEIAQLLKQIGFFWDCKRYYIEDGRELSSCEYTANHNNYSGIASAPSFSTVCEYLRNVHFVHVVIDRNPIGWAWKLAHVKDGHTIRNTIMLYDEYECCLDAAIFLACTYLKKNKT